MDLLIAVHRVQPKSFETGKIQPRLDTIEWLYENAPNALSSGIGFRCIPRIIHSQSPADWLRYEKMLGIGVNTPTDKFGINHEQADFIVRNCLITGRALNWLRSKLGDLTFIEYVCEATKPHPETLKMCFQIPGFVPQRLLCTENRHILRSVMVLCTPVQRALLMLQASPRMTRDCLRAGLPICESTLMHNASAHVISEVARYLSTHRVLRAKVFGGESTSVESVADADDADNSDAEQDAPEE